MNSMRGAIDEPMAATVNVSEIAGFNFAASSVRRN
jgi:hypothetical protein